MYLNLKTTCHAQNEFYQNQLSIWPEEHSFLSPHSLHTVA